MSKKFIKVRDAQVAIYTDKDITNNREYKAILEEALKSDDLKEPRVKEVYLFNSSEKGKIYKYKVEYLDEDGMVKIGPYHLCEDTLHRILFEGGIYVFYPFNPYDNSKFFIGFTEEDVRKKVTKYYTGL